VTNTQIVAQSIFGQASTPVYPIILFLSTTLSTGMTGISLHMQWPLTSQFHGSILKDNVTDQIPRPSKVTF
jgi:hypothetical protein